MICSRFASVLRATPDGLKGAHRQEGTLHPTPYTKKRHTQERSTPANLWRRESGEERAREGVWGTIACLHGEVKTGIRTHSSFRRRDGGRRQGNIKTYGGSGGGGGGWREQCLRLCMDCCHYSHASDRPAIESESEKQHQPRLPIVAECLNRVEGRSEFSAERGDSSSLGRRRAAEHHHPAESG